MAALAEHGYDATNMNDIAARAGVGKAAIYRRWASKSDLLAKVHELAAATAERDPRLKHVHYDWLDAARSTQATVRQLS